MLILECMFQSSPLLLPYFQFDILTDQIFFSISYIRHHQSHKPSVEHKALTKFRHLILLLIRSLTCPHESFMLLVSFILVLFYVVFGRFIDPVLGSWGNLFFNWYYVTRIS